MRLYPVFCFGQCLVLCGLSGFISLFPAFYYHMKTPAELVGDTVILYPQTLYHIIPKSAMETENFIRQNEEIRSSNVSVKPFVL